MILEQIRVHVAEAAKHSRAAKIAEAAAAAAERVANALIAQLDEEEKKLHGAWLAEFTKRQASL